MDAPKPLNIEIFLNKFDLKYKDENINCMLYLENKVNLKIRCQSNKNENFELFEKSFNLSDFKNMNKYFKMFDNCEELGKDLIELSKQNKISIQNIDNSKGILSLCIHVLTLKENEVILDITKNEMNDKEKIIFLISSFKEIKKELKEKDNLILSHEKRIKNLESQITNLLEQIKEIKENHLKVDLNKQVKEDFDLIINESLIIKDKSEIELLINYILKTQNKKIKNIKRIFSSKIDGDNITNFQNKCYYIKNILFIIQTSKNKRFGGYTSEYFEKNKSYQKHDNYSFLFNLNEKKIYGVCNDKNDTYTIWSDDSSDNSIRFGAGTDLRICENFLSQNNQHYTSQSSSFIYNEKEFALNGEEYFNISILEVYQFIF